MARTRDYRRRQKLLHRGREKYTGWLHLYNGEDKRFRKGGSLVELAWRKRRPHILEELIDNPPT